MSSVFANDVLDARTAGGKPLMAPTVNENQVRAAAGLTMLIGMTAFAYAYFDHEYTGLQAVSAFFLFEFLIRITAGITRSPIGVVAGWMTRGFPPDWVSAKPKRFAWTLGTAMAGAMTIITNYPIRGWLPRSICLVCLTLMWLESVLGLCLGCQIHRVMVQRGWIRKDEAFEVCAHGVCDITARRVS
jgi:hypothetical protein